MSNGSKFIVRPKVRFSQAADSDEEKAEGKCLTERDVVSKPRIRSIVNFDKKIKIVSTDDASHRIKEQDAISVGKMKEGPSVSAPANSVLTLATEVVEVDPKPLSDATNSLNIIAETEEKNALKLSNPPPQSGKTAAATSTLPVAQGKLCTNEALELQSTTATNKVRSKRGKENEHVPGKKDVKSMNTPKKTVKRIEIKKPVVQQKVKDKVPSCPERRLYLKGVDEKSAKVAFPKNKDKPLSICKRSAQNTCAGLRNSAKVVSVMPCYKHKVDSKVKAASIKKSVIRDTAGCKIKPYVGPGVMHKKKEVPEKTEATQIAQTKAITASEKLAKPEYNSIMCIINKLKEAQEERIVTDVNHLPDTYKNLINGKVSAALDFPLDEAIYKNLIDLSIDEKQLPSRLIRSKDPEPRQKDIIPQLSDFFVPTDTHEYCNSVSVNPRVPENTNSWSAFKISDKIIEWKQSIDDEQ